MTGSWKLLLPFLRKKNRRCVALDMTGSFCFFRPPPPPSTPSPILLSPCLSYHLQTSQRPQPNSPTAQQPHSPTVQLSTKAQWRRAQLAEQALSSGFVLNSSW